MNKKIIVRIAEGLGNQMFMYANALSLSKKFDYKLLIDDSSGYYKKKDVRNYYLNYFKITSKLAPFYLKFDNFFKNLLRKILIKTELFRKKKLFLVEKKKINKETHFYNINLNCSSNTIYVEGHFECEKYFNNNRQLLLNEFTLKNKSKYENNPYSKFIKKNLNKIISLCVRTDRFSERLNNRYNFTSIQKSKDFTKLNINYIYRAIKKFPKKIFNPIYLIWSNNFTDVKKFFPGTNFVFVENSNNKTMTDFYLLTLCKYFIVGPSSFHWWGAWLSNYHDKICVRPKNINPSSNRDFWPCNWLPL